MGSLCASAQYYAPIRFLLRPLRVPLAVSTSCVDIPRRDGARRKSFLYLRRRGFEGRLNRLRFFGHFCQWPVYPCTFCFFLSIDLSLGGEILVVLNEDEAGWSVCCVMLFQGRDRMPTFADIKVQAGILCERREIHKMNRKLRAGIRAVSRLLRIEEDASADIHAHRAIDCRRQVV